jgi:hypothetical protein
LFCKLWVCSRCVALSNPCQAAVCDLPKEVFQVLGLCERTSLLPQRTLRTCLRHTFKTQGPCSAFHHPVTLITSHYFGFLNSFNQLTNSVVSTKISIPNFVTYYVSWYGHLKFVMELGMCSIGSFDISL